MEVKETMSQPAAPSRLRHWRLSFRVTVVGMFMIMTLATAAVGLSLQFYFSTQLATNATLQLYRQSADRTSDYLSSMDQSVDMTLKLMAPKLNEHDEKPNLIQLRNLFATVLQNHPLFYAAYLGYADGNYYELINLDSGAEVRRQFMALPEDRWVVIAISQTDGKRLKKVDYYDKNFQLRISRSEPTIYNPVERPWYRSATVGTVHKTEPYLFQHLQLPGQTYSIKLPGGHAVLAIDMTLASLSDQLNQHRSDPDSQIFLYQSNGELIASSNLHQTSLSLPPSKPIPLTPAQHQIVKKNPTLAASSLQDWPPFDYTISGQPHGYSIEILSLISEMTGIKFNYVNGPSWPQFVQQFRAGNLDVLTSVMCDGTYAALGAQTQAYANAPYGILTRRDTPKISHIKQLFGKRVAIPAGWSIISFIRQNYPQVDVVEVDGVQGMFSAVRQGTVAAGLDTAAELQYTAREFFYKDLQVYEPLTFDSAAAPTKLCFIFQPSHREVVPIINEALARVTPTQWAVLQNHWLLNAAQEQQLSSTVPYPELVSMAADPDKRNTLQQTDLNGKQQFVFIAPIGGVGKSNAYFAIITPVANVLAPAYAQVRKVMWITLGVLLMMLPMAFGLASFIVKPVKQLAIEEEKIRDKKYGELKQVSSNIVEVDDLAAAQMSMAKAIQKHAEEQEALINSFIKLIAQAIDEKSPYTGAHCARVPELALILAHKADASNEFPFRDFSFKDEHEWREFRIGAWLHDCGKITTPEYIVDKASKLETIYNRIHEIRTRFEVLWRDAEIHYLEQRQQSPEAEPELRAERTRKQAELREQFAFIASCNLGGESMALSRITRLEQLAQITWQRNFDDRLGLSPIEAAHMSQFEQNENLPVTESLLMDKPWHKKLRTHNKTYPERFHIRMDIPELLYNRGELYNLKIEYGTLTTEDRFRINEHVISTIEMLDALPFPDDLKRVPRYASTHHETLDGRGYPRRLTARDLSTPERIMVLADIFEALTASDRPYKRAKPLSEAIAILYRLVEEQHVDRDVFELFLRSGAYLEYARAYIDPKQIDDVDLSHYLSHFTTALL
jgi:HD-GYP domain-containing protein (c-di-GMP phosphodiesterase class II)/ABC-type amino acid transport substrate-binding protein